MAEVIFELLREDPTSFLNSPEWQPELAGPNGSFEDCGLTEVGSRLLTKGGLAGAGGHYLVEAKDIGEAVKIAAKIPGAPRPTSRSCRSFGFPHAGTYRVFVQVKLGGKVQTAAFDARVQ